MSEDQLTAARALQAIGKDCGQIARIIGVHINAVRAQLNLSYQEIMHENMRKMRERAVMRSAQLARERMARSPDTRDLTALFFGDPPYERSALAQKLREGSAE